MDKELNDRLVEIEKRLEKIEKENECNCIKLIDRDVNDIPVSSWFCPKHGQQGR